MNFTGSHPLNLIGKVAIITSCSTPQGASICRALLNSNALVLGIDREMPHPSTQSSKASHFQFLKNSALEIDGGVEILKAVEYHFGRGKVDFLVCVGEGDGVGSGIGGVGKVLEGMAERRRGLVLCVPDGEDEGKIITSAKAASREGKRNGIRWNVILSHEIISNSDHRFILDTSTKEALEEHMKEYASQRESGGYAVEKERDVANVVLFFCSEMGSEISGALVGVDGTCLSL